MKTHKNWDTWSTYNFGTYGIVVEAHTISSLGRGLTIPCLAINACPAFTWHKDIDELWMPCITGPRKSHDFHGEKGKIATEGHGNGIMACWADYRLLL